MSNSEEIEKKLEEIREKLDRIEKKLDWIIEYIGLGSYNYQASYTYSIGAGEEYTTEYDVPYTTDGRWRNMIC